MKKQRSRELLLNTKVAQKWNKPFDMNIDELMELVTKIDTSSHIEHAAEILDVYSRKRKSIKIKKRKAIDADERPFEFLVHNN